MTEYSRTPEWCTSDQLLEHVSQLLAEDLEDGYELTRVNSTKDVSQQTREITIHLGKSP